MSDNQKSQPFRSLTCRITGRNLGQVPQASLAAKLDCVHPIFSQSFSTLTRLAGKPRDLDFADLSALTLALILHPKSSGPLVSLNHPVQFSEADLAKSFGQVFYIARTLANLDRQQWLRLMGKGNNKHSAYRLPKFRTQSVSGSDLLTYYTKTLAACLALESVQDLNVNLLDQGARDLLSASLQEELAIMSQRKKVKAEVITYAKFKTQFQYWTLILQDVANEFDLTLDWIQSMSRQVQKPSDIIELRNLQTYLYGLSEIHKSGDFLTLPSIYYQNAQKMVAELLEEAKSSILDMSIFDKGLGFVAPPKSETILTLTEVPAESVGSTPATSQQVPAQTSTPTNPLLAKFANLAKKAEAQESAKLAEEERITTFVLGKIKATKPAKSKPTGNESFDFPL